MPAKATIPVEALPGVHLAPCMALGFGRHMTVRRHFHVSTLIDRFRSHGPLLQGTSYFAFTTRLNVAVASRNTFTIASPSFARLAPMKM